LSNESFSEMLRRREQINKAVLTAEKRRGVETCVLSCRDCGSRENLLHIGYQLHECTDCYTAHETTHATLTSILRSGAEAFRPAMRFDEY
jgi:hypothetical protein